MMRAGFTLLEALVVLAIFAIAAAAITPMLSIAADTHATSERLVRRLEDEALARRVLETVLSRAIPPPYEPLEGASRRQAQFEGDERHILFVARTPAALGQGLATFELSIVDDDEGLKLDLAWGGLARDPSHHVTLLSALASASFSFAKLRTDYGAEQAWEANASDAEPVRHVRLSYAVASRPDDTKSIDIYLKLDRSLWCDFDPVKLDCRAGT